MADSPISPKDATHETAKSPVEAFEDAHESMPTVDTHEKSSKVEASEDATPTKSEQEPIFSNATATNGSSKEPAHEKANTGSAAQNVDPPQGPEQPKVGPVKRLLDKLGLSIGVLLIMFKGSVPPVIGIAIYQSTSVSVIYGSLGYLIPIVSVISLAILPRAKFFQNLILNLLAVCVGAAVAMLGLWSAVQARQNTTPPNSTSAYNSSASAVCAIWLIANVWGINVLRAKYPQLQVTVIMYSMLTNLSFTFGPSFYSMDQVKPFIKQLLEGFLTAFAIATGVNLFIIPISSRDLVDRENAQYINAVRRTLTAQTAYLQSLERSDMFAQTTSGTPSVEDHRPNRLKRHFHPPERQLAPEAQALKDSIKGLTELHGKLHADVPFAKRETAFGKLSAADYSEIFQLFRTIMIPLIGMSTIQDIFERVAIRRGWIQDPSKTALEAVEGWEQSEDKTAEKIIWNEVMKTLHEPFTTLSRFMDEGMEHAGLLLEMLPRPKKHADEDVEQAGEEIKPGDAKFSELLEQKINEFHEKRGEALRIWAKQKGLSKTDFDSASAPAPNSEFTPAEAKHRRDQQQLYLILYMEYLLHATGKAILDLCHFADKKVEDGTMKKRRLIIPSKERLIKWARSIGSDDAPADGNNPHLSEGGSSTVYLGSSFNTVKKDPEHLPPKNTWEKFGNVVRSIPHFCSSEEAAFGVRVVCATMTVGICAFLEVSQTFFIQQRLVWAMIIIAIGMTMTSGQSTFGFFARLAGTTLSMCFAFVIWYIVDQKTTGIIVMLWLFIFIQMYFFLMYPRFIAVWLICIITEVLIIGYELQVRKIGIQAAEANGQPYYPIYELGPIRLATIAGGTFVSFIWVFLPYPLTDRSWLRKDLAASLYLLANYYSVVHSSINGRLHQTLGDLSDKSSPGSQLDHIRHKIFSKLTLLLPSLESHSEFQKWEISIGGKFPRHTYDEIILHVSNLSKYISLMSFCSQNWGQPESPEASQWTRDFVALVDTISPTSHQITSVLTLLSSAVRNGHALPPYMILPQPFHLSERLEQLDKSILDTRHIEEAAYSAYAVMQVASGLVVDDLQRLVENVKELVGEVDFSFHVTDSARSSSTMVKDQGQGVKGPKQD